MNNPMRIIPEGTDLGDWPVPDSPPNTEFIFPESYSQVDYVNQPYGDAYREQARIAPTGYVDYDTGIVYKFVGKKFVPTGEKWTPQPMYLHDSRKQGILFDPKESPFYWNRSEPDY